MSAGRAAARAGTTLLELLVVLAVLAVAAGLTGIALNRREEPAPPSFAARIADARREAIRIGRAVTLTLSDSTGTYVVRAAPDGTVLGGSPFAVDWVSGHPAHATR